MKSCPFCAPDELCALHQGGVPINLTDAERTLVSELLTMYWEATDDQFEVALAGELKDRLNA